MKYLISTVALVILNLAVSAQITVHEYDRAFKVDANDVPSPNVEFSSTCGEVKVEISEHMASGGCIGNLIRTYNVTDNCGNTAFAEQYLSLQDKVGPEILGVPENITASEKEIPELPAVAATDLGDKTIDVQVSETRKGNKLTRTWTAKDQCGNVSTKEQVITIKGRKKS